ncbi:hypothetical protein OEA41_005350 [Lepraria neglecta]|uniref:Protein kinase domain-containing protein n=1 Tax=Lepraria neglecta TaxID=209136 RepID=A0AAD9Z222_9LECA|nr:hypothetical protein OEA41_005350 [Lepraria neglecta]
MALNWLARFPEYFDKHGYIDETTSQAARNHELAAHLHAVKREIDALCDPALRNHHNIVKLLYWGLCPDTLESLGDEALRIPVLILERAEADLETFLGIHNDVPYGILRQICLDFGEGLGALHAEGISHGDLKPVSVLIFRQDVQHEHQQRYTAKLCDFGSDRSDIEGDKKGMSYASSRGWRAPDALEDSKLLSGALKRCDVYAYGLFVKRLRKEWETTVVQG